jgi:hypothetical protein
MELFNKNSCAYYLNAEARNTPSISKKMAATSKMGV